MPNDNIQPSQGQTTAMVRPHTAEIQLRLIDWQRIYRKTRSIRAGVSRRGLLAGFSWGVSASALLSLIPLHQASQPMEARARPALWSIAVASGIAGLAIWRTAKDCAAEVKLARAELIADMEAIHSLCFPGWNLDQGTRLAIHSASYGSAGRHIDVTDAVRARITGDTLEITSGNHLGGDPDFGVPKTLTIDYSFDGMQRSRVIPEGSVERLP